MTQNHRREHRLLPVGRKAVAAGRNKRLPERGATRFVTALIIMERAVDDKTDKDCPPMPVPSAAPERDLERKLKRNPDDLDAKADVGSDESMDASDPSAAAQPGRSDDPVPSSDFPE
jgi:hypothetical protein